MIENAQKFVIDSVYDGKFRLVISKTSRSFPKNITSKDLAKFENWNTEKSEIIKKEKAYKTLGVRSNRIIEGKVFVKLEDQTFEITEFVRQEVKEHYKQLLKREFVPAEEGARNEL